MQGIFSLYIYTENFKNLLVRNRWIKFIVTCRNVALVTFYQDCSRLHDMSKNMTARGRGLFFVYICIEIFKILLVRNHLTDFNITWQECCLVTLYQDCSSNRDLSKNMAARVGLIFPIYLNRKL